MLRKKKKTEKRIWEEAGTKSSYIQESIYAYAECLESAVCSHEEHDCK